MKPYIQVPIEWGAADRVCGLVLDDFLEILECDLREGKSVFVKNKARDKAIIKQHIEAIKLIKKYLEPK